MKIRKVGPMNRYLIFASWSAEKIIRGNYHFILPICTRWRNESTCRLADWKRWLKFFHIRSVALWVTLLIKPCTIVMSQFETFGNVKKFKLFNIQSFLTQAGEGIAKLKVHSQINHFMCAENLGNRRLPM